MIWPWSEIRKWKQLAQHHEARADAQGRRLSTYRNERK